MIHLYTEYHALMDINKMDLYALKRKDIFGILRIKDKLQSSTYDKIFVKQTHISDTVHVPLWIEKNLDTLNC